MENIGGNAVVDCSWRLWRCGALVDECGECGGNGPENNFDCEEIVWLGGSVMEMWRCHCGRLC